MPNLASATAPRDTSNMTLITPSAPTVQSPQLNASADPEFSALALAPIPPVLGTDTDAQRQFYRRGVSQLRMPPLPSQAKIAIGATAQSQVINQQFIGGGGPDLMVNNVANPVQNILNLTGPGVSYGPAKGQVQIGGSNSVGVPGFFNLPGGPTTGVFVSNLIGSSANAVGGFLFYLPTEIVSTNLTFNIQNADATFFYVFGLYGPFDGVMTSIPLACETASAQYTSSPAHGVTVAWEGGPFTLQAGYYFFYITSDGTPGALGLYGTQAVAWEYPAFAIDPSTGTGASLALPASMTAPAKTLVVQTGGTGSNQPQQVYFVLS